MRCERCGFHNLPGTATCVSCRSSLGAPRAPATAAAVTPPRRDPWRKLLDRLWDRVRLNPGRPDIDAEAPAAPLLGAVPGLAQAARGHRALALAFLVAWGAAMAGVLATFGSGWETPCLGLAVFVQAASALHPYRRSLAGLSRGRRALLAAGVALLLALVLYLPLLWLASAVVHPIRLQVPLPLAGLERNDVLLVRSYAFGRQPQRGDLVVYDPGGYWGAQIDRVLGVPGDRLAVLEGVLSCNGTPVPANLGPASSAAPLPADLDVVVPAERWFVWPSSAAYYADSGFLLRMALVPAERLRGRAWMVYHPRLRRRVLPPDGEPSR